MEPQRRKDAKKDAKIFSFKKKPLRSSLCAFAVPSLSFTCLTIGSWLAGQGMALAAFLAAFLAWVLARRWRSPGLATTALILSVAVAVAGLLAGASPYLMMPGVALALASWDLTMFEVARNDRASVQAFTPLERKHYWSLALAVGTGLLAAVAGRLVHLQIPFIGMAALALLALFSLDRIWRNVEKERRGDGKTR